LIWEAVIRRIGRTRIEASLLAARESGTQKLDSKSDSISARHTENISVTPVLAEFRMNKILIDLEIRNQQVGGSNPRGGSIILKHLVDLCLLN
jgi:hypothetical protein